jgi:thioredoxin reductase (NADPH)
MKLLDCIIIGAGPAGLSCAIEAQRAGLMHLIIEKGSVVNSIRQFQHTMAFFSTPELLEIGGVPFVVPTTRPTTIDCVNYYRRVTEHFGLSLQCYEQVERIGQVGDNFAITTSKGTTYVSRNVVNATGYYDWPGHVNVPGEDLPHVRHYYHDPFAYARQKVLVVGGKNSAVEAALDLHRHGAIVTLVHRGATLSQGVKYWILPDFENRVKEGSIKALFNSRIVEFQPGETTIMAEEKTPSRVPTDFAFVLIGYVPDMTLMKEAGVRIDEETLGPVFDPGTMETNVHNLFVAGGLAGGKFTNRVFIENGREHGKIIIRTILARS